MHTCQLYISSGKHHAQPRRTQDPRLHQLVENLRGRFKALVAIMGLTADYGLADGGSSLGF